MNARARGAALLSACLLAGALGGYAGAHEGVKPVNTQPVTIQPAWADGCTTDTDCAEMEAALNKAGLYLTGGGEVSPEPAEDQPGWNCLTMGNLECGPDWVPVTAELGDALAEGEDFDTGYPDSTWDGCLVNGTPGDAITVVCPDGYVTTQ